MWIGWKNEDEETFQGSSCRVGLLNDVESNGERRIREDSRGSRGSDPGFRWVLLGLGYLVLVITVQPVEMLQEQTNRR